MGRQEVQPQDDRTCSCGHKRSEHVDYAWVCDECPCTSFDGFIPDCPISY